MAISFTSQKHAVLSASSSKRWLTCTPSARLEEKFPNNTSVFAEEGTAAHEQGEYKIKKYLHMRMKKPVSEYDCEEMDTNTDIYAGFVIETIEKIKETCKYPLILVEERLDFSHVVPDGFGTGDVVIVADDTLHIIDLKYGKGVEVSADHNPQMMLYALGALHAYDFIYDINTVSMTIVQPRLENISTFTCSVEELKEWAESYVRPRALLAYKGEGDTVPGDHCRFCRAKPRCRACADEALKLAKYEFQEPELLEHEEIEDMLPLLNRISRWIESVFTFVSDEAINHGVSWAGYKVVEGRSKRTFIDEKAVAEAAVEAGYNDIYKQSLISLTEFEKLMGKKNFQQILGGFVYKPSGKLTLVPEEDKRPAVDLGVMEAESEFEVLD